MAKKVDVNKLKTEIKTLIENESSYNMGFAGDYAIELLWTVIDIIDELEEKEINEKRNRFNQIYARVLSEERQH